MSGLGQDDFRRMMATPRVADSQSSSTTRAFGMKTPRPGGVSELSRKAGGVGRSGGMRDSEGRVAGGKDSFEFKKPEPKKKKLFKKKKGGSDDDDEDSKSSSKGSYRDRAAERRLGNNPDYEESERILEVLGSGTPRQAGAHTPLVSGTPRLAPPDLSKPASSFILPTAPTDDVSSGTASEKTTTLSDDMTQYLGGSITHTHLVRGLDRTLLTRIRSDIEAEDLAERDRRDAEEWERRQKEESSATFHSASARSIHDLAVLAPRRTPPEFNDMFVRSRMAFQWDLGFATGANGLGVPDPADYLGSPDLPTTIVRSKQEPTVQAALAQLADRSERMVVDKVCLAIRQARVARGERVDGMDEEEKRRLRKQEKERKKKEREKMVRDTVAQGGGLGVLLPSAVSSNTHHSKASLANAPASVTLVVGNPDDDIFADAPSEYVLEVDPERKARAETEVRDEDADDSRMDVDGDNGGRKPAVAVPAVLGNLFGAKDVSPNDGVPGAEASGSTHDRIARLVRAAGGRMDGDLGSEMVGGSFDRGDGDGGKSTGGKSLLEDLLEEEEAEKMKIKEEKERTMGRKGKRGGGRGAGVNPLDRPSALVGGGYGEEGGFDGYGSSDEESSVAADKKKKGGRAGEMAERAEEAMKRNRDKQRAEIEVQRIGMMMDAKAKGGDAEAFQVVTAGNRKRENDAALFGEWDGGKKQRK
ncbi:Smu-2 suppressor of mec-8 and unc-52 protein [Gonapodya sp. JEL0774]|nr:Smu-2 suppressor of mec-8 and unc-52 protein [Gonapodya sp. JEL0774]